MKKTFLWGAATSAHQVEGYNSHSDWWEWEQRGNIEGGTQSGQATDHYHRYAEDLRLAAEMNLNSYRFSIEWAKVEPEEGKWDTAAIDWYRKLVHECEKLKLLPLVTLHHFTLPNWVAHAGGVAAPEFPQWFLRYTTRIVEELGAHIPIWCTVNEPMVLIAGGYLGRFMPPAVFDPRAVGQCTSNLLLAHCRAYRLIHSSVSKRVGPWKSHPLQVGLAQNLLHFLPARTWSISDRALRYFVHRFYNRAFLDAVTGKGQCFSIPGLIPRTPLVQEARGQRTVDYIGLNYYTKAYLRWNPKILAKDASEELRLEIAFARRGDRVSDLGWAIHPKGFEWALRFCSRYRLPIYVTENGIADSSDRLRADYIREHLGVVAKLQKSCDIRGYYYWSLLDNFEWVKGFGPRFGLLSVDYSTLERKVRGSVRVYREWIDHHTR